MPKQLVFNEEARRALTRGIEAVSKSVKTTLGPKGRNVALGKKFGGPTVTHDGVTVAKEIELPDPFENMGAQLLKEAASKTNDIAGDGTTTATVLAEAIVFEGMRNVAAGANPMILQRGLHKGTGAVVQAIKDQATEVKGREEIANIAAISANDREIGQLIGEVMDKVGKDGVITVEESRGIQFEVEYVEGMQFDRGYISPYFVSNADRMMAELEEPFILITERQDHRGQDMLPGPGADGPARARRRLVLIAEEVEGEALATLVVNKLRGILNVLAVKAPGYGDRRKEMLKDIAVLTGGTVISDELGRKLDSVAHRGPGAGPAGGLGQGQHHRRRGAGLQRRGAGAHQADQGPDRGHHLGLRPGEAAGAPGQALRGGGRDQGGRRHGDGAEGEEAPRGGRPLRHPRRHRGGHRPRGRGGPAQRHVRPRRPQAGGGRGHRRRPSCAGPWRSRPGRSPPTPATRAP